MAQRFWAEAQDDLSESEEEQKVEQVEVRKPVAPVQPRQAANRWALTHDSSDEEKRVVKSAADKSFDQIKRVFQKADNHMKIKDYAALQDDYENFLKIYEKSRSAIQSAGVPTFIIANFCKIENFVAEQLQDRQSFKKLTKTKATALNTLKSKLKRGCDEFRELMDKYNDDKAKNLIVDGDKTSSSEEDMDVFSADDSVDMDQKSREEKIAGRKPDTVENTAAATSDSEAESKSEEDDSESDESEGSSKTDSSDDDDSSEWSESNSSLSENEADQGEVAFEDRHQRALSKWGAKQQTTGAASKTKPSSANKAVRAPKPKPVAAPTEKKADDQGGPSGAVPCATQETLTKLSRELISQRGRRTTDKKEMLQTLQRVVEESKSWCPEATLEMLGFLVSAYFDTSLGSFNCLTSAHWVASFEHIESILKILKAHPEMRFNSTLWSTETDRVYAHDFSSDNTAAVMGTVVGSSQVNTESGLKRVMAIVASFCERLDDELMKAMQFTDIHSDEYKVRLRSTIDMIGLLWLAYVFFYERGDYGNAEVVALRILEHCYYKPDSLGRKVWESVSAKLVDDVKQPLLDLDMDPSRILKFLYESVTKHSHSPRSWLRSLMHIIYNRALHDDYEKAKFLMQVSNLPELVPQCDVSTQLLYNRCLVLLGLSAFRCGRISDASACLSELCAMNRLKELLAQGVSQVKNQEKSIEQEREEKRRQLPFHMHLSLELIEAVHNISAMLLEVPHMAANPFDSKRKPISRTFTRMLESSDKLMFVGPPENARESVIAATRALKRGNYSECCRYIFAMKMWEMFEEKEAAQTILENEIKLTALRTFLFTYSSYYDSLSISQLCELFDMPTKKIHSTVSKMIIQGELSGSWDESSTCITMNKVEPTQAQVVALQLSDRISSAVEQIDTLNNFHRNPRYVMQTEMRAGRKQQDESRWDRSQRFQRPMRSDFGYNRGATKGPQPVNKDDSHKPSMLTARRLGFGGLRSG